MLFIVLKSCKIKDRRRICDRDRIWPLKPVPLRKYPWSKAKGIDWAMFLSSFSRQQQGSKRERKHAGVLQLTFESGTVFLLLYSVGQSKSQVGWNSTDWIKDFIYLFFNGRSYKITSRGVNKRRRQVMAISTASHKQ